MKIILASGSPRRRALLKDLGLAFDVYSPNADETHIPDEAPEALCVRLSRLKAESAAQKFPDAVVIAADTIVVIDGQILGKPANRHDAVRMLTMLQGREHEVLTGVCVISHGKVLSCAERTLVKFRALTNDEITAYSETGECDDKAGAYAVQGKGALLVESISGDYFNVVGLPLCRLGIMLPEAGVNLLA
ncbi:MAG: septum formation inhibitor Maf [Synergistaceae bacterium]|nr:septum formation inhibitor Maf [Synergistaceae bacterium]